MRSFPVKVVGDRSRAVSRKITREQDHNKVAVSVLRRGSRISVGPFHTDTRIFDVERRCSEPCVPYCWIRARSHAKRALRYRHHSSRFFEQSRGMTFDLLASITLGSSPRNPLLLSPSLVIDREVLADRRLNFSFPVSHRISR